MVERDQTPKGQTVTTIVALSTKYGDALLGKICEAPLEYSQRRPCRVLHQHQARKARCDSRPVCRPHLLRRQNVHCFRAATTTASSCFNELDGPITIKWSPV